jgi:hypothetical protein
MTDVTNNSQRLIWMGNVMCVPGQTTTVDDVWAAHPRYVELETKGDVTTGAPPPPLEEPIRRQEAPAATTPPVRPAVSTPPVRPAVATPPPTRPAPPPTPATKA